MKRDKEDIGGVCSRLRRRRNVWRLLKTGGSVAAVGNDVAEDERETLEKQRQEAMLAVGGRRSASKFGLDG